jgi:hypothetical protein
MYSACGYIVYNDLPKIVNLQRLLPEYYEGRPIRLAGSDP